MLFLLLHWMQTGKSSLVLRYSQNVFCEELDPTIGGTSAILLQQSFLHSVSVVLTLLFAYLDVYRASVQIPGCEGVVTIDPNDHTIKTNLSIYFHQFGGIGAVDAVIFTYALNASYSFQEIQDQLQMLKEGRNSPYHESLPIVRAFALDAVFSRPVSHSYIFPFPFSSFARTKLMTKRCRMMNLPSKT
jgi:hypothetical protein